MLKLGAKGLILSGKVSGKRKEVQKWLDKNYPNSEKRNEEKEIEIISKNLCGSLSLSEFINLERFINQESWLINLDLTDCPKLKKFECRYMSGEITFTDCSNLEELNLFGSLFVNLDFLINANKLKKIDNANKLKKIDIRHNNFSRSDLKIFSRFSDLEELKIGGYSIVASLKRINDFYGSLEPLKNLTKLRILSIDCTDIDSGLEYLPESLEVFSCSLSLEDRTGKIYTRENAKVKKIIEELKPYNGDWKKWQVNNLDLVVRGNPEKTLQKIQNLENELQNLLNQSNIDNEKFQKEIFELKKERDLLKNMLNKELPKQIERKEQELVELKKIFKKLEHACEDLLESVDYLATADLSTNHDHYWNIKEKNTKRLRKAGFSEEKIEELCELQTEVAQLKLKLEDLKPKKQLLLTSNQKEQLFLEFSDYPIFAQELFKQTNNYLHSKEDFISLRKKTVSLLQEIVNVIENKTVVGSGKYVRLEKGSNLLKSTLKIAPIPVPYVKEIIGETVPLIIDHFKGKFKNESVELFREHLTKSDNVSEIIKQRDFLLKIINKNPHFNSSQSVIELFNLNDEERLFNEEYEIYKVATNIWVNKPTITLDDMKTAISELSKNLNSLERELKQERQEINKLSGEVINLEQQVMSFSIQQA